MAPGRLRRVQPWQRFTPPAGRRAQEKIAEVGADAALITSGPNVRYLTGLASSNAALLLAADGTAVLATDSRYTLAAQRDCPDLELVIERFIEPRLAAEMTSRGLRTVAFEAHEMSVERHQELAAKAGRRHHWSRSAGKSRSCGRSRIRPSSSCSRPPAGSPARPSPTCSR